MNLLTSLKGKVLLVALLTVAFTPFLTTGIAKAATFDPTRIIEDGVFYNSSAMSVQQIQDFLNTKVPTCDTNHAGFVGGSGTTYSPPWICLKDYYENNSSTYTISYSYQNTSGTVINVTRTFTRNNEYAYTALTPIYNAGGYTQGLKSIAATLQNINGVRPTGSISAAQIIWNAAQTYGINPQVILVTLQKETGLVNDTWPAPWQYQEAMGYTCTDSAPCNDKYSGFYNQVISAAWQFRDYANNPNNYNYVPGPGNNVYYNPNASCGYTTLNIQNQATASLYDYTPYQPNAAALAAGYGTGDACSAYGNRNFWLYFNAWFPYNIHSRDGHLVTSVSNGMYVVDNGTKRPFPNEGTFLSYGYKFTDALVISDVEMKLIPDGVAMPFSAHHWDGHLVTSVSNGMYVVDNGSKRPFPNEVTFLSYGYKFTDALVISNSELSLIPGGVAMAFNAHHWDGHLVTSASSGLYVIDNGTRRPFANEETFYSYSYKYSDALVISSAEISLIPDGVAMPYNVHFRDGKLVQSSGGGGVYYIDNGTKRSFPNEATFLSYSYTWAQVISITPTEISLIPNGSVMTSKT